MAKQLSYILATFQKPPKRETILTFTTMGMGAVSQLSILYLAGKNNLVFLGGLSVLALGCFLVSLTLVWTRYSRQASASPAIWIDSDDFVINVDKPRRISVADIQDYTVVFSEKLQRPVELKLLMHNKKSQSFSLDDVGNISALVDFLNGTVNRAPLFVN